MKDVDVSPGAHNPYEQNMWAEILWYKIHTFVTNYALTEEEPRLILQNIISNRATSQKLADAIKSFLSKLDELDFQEW